MNTIEKNIISFWHDYSDIPQIIDNSITATGLYNPDFKMMKYDDASILVLINEKYGNELSNLYKNISIPAARSDIARLILLKEYGGIYIDAAIEVTRDLSYLTENTSMLLVANDLNTNMSTFSHMINGFIGAKKGHPLISEFLSIVIDTLISKKLNQSVWFATGPFILNLLIKRITQENIRIISLSSMLAEGWVKWNRQPGVSNQWVTTQYKGIVDDNFFIDNRTPKNMMYLHSIYNELLNEQKIFNDPQIGLLIGNGFMQERDYLSAIKIYKLTRNAATTISINNQSLLISKIDMKISKAEKLTEQNI